MHEKDVLDFWFHTLSPADWWKKDDALDQQISQQFMGLHRKATLGELHEWRYSALGALAEVILLDQFSRNIFRGKRESFAYDGMALVLAQMALHQGFDRAVSPSERAFFFMPFMHSESMVIHSHAKKLFQQPGMETYYDFEQQHAAIIEHFGRYPHRNAILGRPSTSEEQDFLERPSPAF